MPEREWKPGDVAMVRTSAMIDGDKPGVRAFFTLGGWASDLGGHAPWREVRDDGEARPLAVIDPENAEEVERLVDLYWSVRKGDRTRISAMQAALREFADPKPPKPEEPTGLGAVVEVAKGSRWIRVWGAGVHQPWQGCEGDDEPDVRRHYGQIAVIRVLSPGYTPWLLEGDDA